MVVVLFDLEGTLVRSVEGDPKAVQDFRVKTRERLIELAVPAGVLEGSVRSAFMRNVASEDMRAMNANVIALPWRA